MVVEDAKRKGKDCCVHCAEQFAIADMRLITRSQDPYIQYDDEERSESKGEHWIAVAHRCRACKPCFTEHYESEG